MSLQIFNTTRRPLSEEHLIEAITLVVKSEGHAIHLINAIYCGNRLIRRINLDFLGHDYTTDTITFIYSDGKLVDGEFYISLDEVEQNARRFEVRFEDELLRVTVHSALHLVGYDDESEEMRAEMTMKEDHYLRRLAGSGA